MDQIREIYEVEKRTGYIESLNIHRNMTTMSTKLYDIEVVLSTCPLVLGDTRIKLSFSQVDELKLGNIDNFNKVFVEIFDLEDRPYGDSKYYIDETVYNSFSFYCHNFEYEML